MDQARDEPAFVFDSFDIDLVVKVLSHTAFSQSRSPLSRRNILHQHRPVLYLSLSCLLFLPGQQTRASLHLSVFCVLLIRIAVLCVVSYHYTLVANPSSFQGLSNGTLGCIATKEVCSSGQVQSTGVNKLSSSPEVRVTRDSLDVC